MKGTSNGAGRWRAELPARLTRRDLLRLGGALAVGGLAARQIGCRRGKPPRSVVGTAEGGPPSAVDPARQATPFAVEPPRHTGGQIVEGALTDVATVNPIYANDPVSHRVVDLMFDALVGVDPATGAAQPLLATSWDVSSDGRAYTFHLREGPRWHDGQPVTADDVAVTYRFLRSPDGGSPFAQDLSRVVQTVDVLDPRTVRFTLTAPNAAFLVTHMTHGLVPARLLARVAPADLPQHPFSFGDPARTVGTGPFRFQEWRRDDHLALTKNPDYWQGPPALDGYVLQVVPSVSDLLDRVARGEIDVAPIEGSAADSLQGAAHLRVIAYDSLACTFYAYQLDPHRAPLFQERKVRQALLYALDRPGMVRAIRGDAGAVALGAIPPASWAYDPGGPPERYDYDPERAKRLLDEAGWVPGPDGIRRRGDARLAFTAYTNADNGARVQYLRAMQAQWKAIGVDCEPQAEEWGALVERITTTRDYDLVLAGIQWGIDPDPSMLWACDPSVGRFNVSHYCNPIVDQLLTEGLATTDRAARRRLYAEVQSIVLEDLPVAFLDFPKQQVALNQRVHNVFPNPLSVTANARVWWVDP